MSCSPTIDAAFRQRVRPLPRPPSTPLVPAGTATRGCFIESHYRHAVAALGIDRFFVEDRSRRHAPSSNGDARLFQIGGTSPPAPPGNVCSTGPRSYAPSRSHAVTASFRVDGGPCRTIMERTAGRRFVLGPSVVGPARYPGTSEYQGPVRLPGDASGTPWPSCCCICICRSTDSGRKSSISTSKVSGVLGGIAPSPAPFSP